MSSVTTALRLAPLLRSGGVRRRDAASLLPVASFAVVTALLMLVIAGARVFFSWDDELASIYQILAVIALALLVVPLASVGASAARMAARRRDDRLSSLRLLGASRGTLTALTLIEAVVLSALGALGGIVLYAVFAPAVGLLTFRGEALGAGMWMPWRWVPLIAAGVVVLGALSALAGLRAVNVTPLGVRTRQRPAASPWRRLLVGLGVVVLAAVLVQAVPGFGQAGGIVVMTLAVGVAFGAGLLALDLIGPWVLRVFANIKHRRAKDVQSLIAARTVLEDPKAVWRQVGGVAVTSFVGVFAAAGLAFARIAGSEDMSAGEQFLMVDISTGVLVTLAGSFLMVACSMGLNQAAATLDRAPVLVSMDRLGMPRKTMNAATAQALMSAVWVVSGGSALCAVLLLAPLLGIALFVQPLALVTVAAVFAAGFLLVRGALFLAARLVPGILARPERVL
ncbi:permease [Kocuria polaris]|nr:permease [Kocuria polaris]